MTTNSYSDTYDTNQGISYNTDYSNMNSVQDSYDDDKKSYQSRNYYGRSNIQWENSLRG